MKYMLMFCRNGDAPNFEEMPPDFQQQIEEAVTRWQTENRSLIQSGARLGPAAAATTVRRKDDRVLITDGPFVESNEVVAGYVIVEVSDLDEALRMAKTFPACQTVEIRPLAEQ